MVKLEPLTEGSYLVFWKNGQKHFRTPGICVEDMIRFGFTVRNEEQIKEQVIEENIKAVEEAKKIGRPKKGQS